MCLRWYCITLRRFPKPLTQLGDTMAMDTSRAHKEVVTGCKVVAAMVMDLVTNEKIFAVAWE